MTEERQSDVRAFATWPLSPLTIQNYVSMQNRQQQGLGEVDATLPFDVAAHVRTHVSKSMVERLQKDSAAYAEKENKGASSKLKLFSKNEIISYVNSPNSDSLTKAIALVETLISNMSAAHQQDLKYISIAIENVVKAANFVPGISTKNPNTGMDEGALLSRLSFVLQRVSQKEPKIWFEFMVAALLSSDGEKDLKMWNPFLSDSEVKQVRVTFRTSVDRVRE